MSFVDACKGFNQVANTKRAREMLAILARSGQFLPMCLTFGPCNGPEDFAFATDRIIASGRNRKQCFCTNWQIYADDVTVRTGRVLDGVIYTDDEYRGRVSDAVNRYDARQQELTDAFKAMGFNPDGLGKDKEGKLPKAKRSAAKARSKTEGEKGDDGLTPASGADPSPYAHLVGYSRWSFGLGGANRRLHYFFFMLAIVPCYSTYANVLNYEQLPDASQSGKKIYIYQV
mgnify:CR=1 FL=1